jgi:sugar phosphate isomerase/epimerase
MYTMRNVWFTHPDADVRENAVREFEDIIEVAAEFGADVNVSRVRGSLEESDSYEDGLARLSGCLERISAKAGKYGLSILLEQMNRYETNYLFSCADIGDYIRKLGIPNLKIHADLFHMNIEDVDLPKTLKKYAGLLGFIHFADSNRLAPGSGNIDFTSILDTLNEINYSRWIGIEILTKPDPYTAAKQSLGYIRALEAKTGCLSRYSRH